MLEVLVTAVDVILAGILSYGIWRFSGSILLNVIVAIIFSAAIFTHYKSAKAKGIDFLKDAFAIREASGRICMYDYLRVLAVLMVIGIHVFKTDFSDGLIQNVKICNIQQSLEIWFESTNVIFVMLSGAFLLKYKGESLGHFFKRRFSKVLIPMVVYYLFYVWITQIITDFSVDSLRYVLLNFITANNPSFPHFWFMYMLLSVYIAIPFLRYMLKDMPYEKLTWLVVLTIVFSVIQVIVPAIWGLKIGISFVFVSWVGIAIIGYWITREETAAYYKPIIMAGLIAFIVAIWLVANNENYSLFTGNMSPIMELMGMGTFAIFLQWKKLFKKEPWIIRIASKYSYQIILIHWWTLMWITRGKLHIRVDSLHGFGMLVSILVTALISLVAAIIIDHMVTDVFLKKD